MQTTSAAFTAEQKDTVRKIVQNLLVSWKKQSTLGNRTFTIGVSIIGGSDVIGINPGAVGSPGNYKYFDETDYVMSLAWESGFNMPTGGLTKALAEAELSNTSGRFTPRYMGGNSELFTAILTRRPVIINAGFHYNGIDQTIPQFSGVLSEKPRVNMRDKTVHLKMEDYVGFFQNKKVDKTVMFTGLRTDQVIENLFVQAGMSTAQYDLDTGINVIPFGLFEAGTQLSSAVHKLIEAENGHGYQDEEGVFRFENRQHWDSAPYTQVQRVITTAMVLNADSTDESHLINSVEVKNQIRRKQPSQIIFVLAEPVSVLAGQRADIYVSFTDPVLEMETPTYTANTQEDGSGNDLSSVITIVNIDQFAQAARITFKNNGSSTGLITSMTITGRPAKIMSELYHRAERSASVTAYEERPLSIANEFIQDETWAASLAQMILNDYAEPENIQKITIRAMPDLQKGDLISWQGRYWRVYDIKVTLDPSIGFVMDLLLLQRTITSYFRIGISTIGGTDKIAP